MRRRLKRLAALSLAVTAAVAPFDARAKAKDMWMRVENLEAIVTSITAESASDGSDMDYDILLRPPRPDDTALFWSYFWRPGYEWDEDNWYYYIFGDLFDDKGDKPFSKQCEQCAGNGPQGTGCKVDSSDLPASNPCPKLFSCRECVYDLGRLSDTAKEDYFPKLEIFIGPNNEPNNSLGTAMQRLGLDYTAQAHEAKPLCDEIAWDHQEPGSWYETQSGICGRRVWLTGWVSHDWWHAMRPEVHPVSRVIVEDLSPVPNQKRFKVGTFVDGSKLNYKGQKWDCWGNWRYDYRSCMEAVDYPSVVPIAFAQNPFGVPKPAVAPCAQGSNQGTCTAVNLVWQLNETFSFGTPKPTVKISEAFSSALGQEVWPTYTVSMDRTPDSEGAAWIADVVTGWSVDTDAYALKVTASPDGPTGGLVAIDPMQASKNVDAAALSGKGCVVPKGTTDNDGLRRWFKWKIQASAALESGAENKKKGLTWAWKSPFGSKFTASPTGVVESGKTFETSVWVPAPSQGGRKDTLTTTLESQSNPVKWVSNDVSASVAPSIDIVVSPAKMTTHLGKATYTANVSAKISGFCQEPFGVNYVWWINGASAKPLWVGKSPHEIVVKPGEKTVIDVVVTDPLGVQLATASKVLQVPKPELNPQITCADNVTLIDASLPAGWSTAGKPETKIGLCKSVQINVTPSLESDAGALVLANTSVADLALNWSDNEVEVATADTGGKFVPLSKLSNLTLKLEKPDKKKNTTLRIHSNATKPFQFIAKVTLFNLKTGETFVEPIYGSNDFSSPEVAAQRLEWLWKVWRPGQPLPEPIPCQGRCETSPRRPATDPFEKHFAALLHRVKSTPNQGALHSMNLGLNRFVDGAFNKYSKESGKAYAALAKPPKKPKPGKAHRMGSQSARAKLMGRLAKDPKFTRFVKQP